MTYLEGCSLHGGLVTGQAPGFDPSPPQLRSFPFRLQPGNCPFSSVDWEDEPGGANVGRSNGVERTPQGVRSQVMSLSHFRWKSDIAKANLIYVLQSDPKPCPWTSLVLQSRPKAMRLGSFGDFQGNGRFPPATLHAYCILVGCGTSHIRRLSPPLQIDAANHCCSKQPTYIG